MGAHEDRVRAIQAAFVQALDQLINQLDSLDDKKATENPAGGWNAAQIGWHVALTNEFLSSVLRGDVTDMNVPRPADFQEQLATMQFPDKVKTYPMLEPPADASRAEAIAKLRSSADAFARALAATTPGRYAETCVQMPFGATFSVYEVGEFMGAHVHRHLGQMDRTVGA